ncbi:hypothetical protein Tco_0573116 [Tanacetum coccineum]
MDYSSLNKACSKDMYPFPEEGEELASLMGYPYKFFLRLSKEYSQIRMAEDDKEKTGFHTKEGVYCFTHMLKELKNSVATLQRMMEKVLAEKRTKRGNTLGGYSNKKQNKGGKVPWPLAISKFIPKLAELKHPLHEVQTRMETSKETGWMNEAEEALRRIKRKLGKLQTLAIPKEGETLMLWMDKVCTTDRKGRNPDTCFLCEPTSARNGDMLHPNEKRVQALIRTTISLRTIFRKHKVKVVTDGPIEEILKLSGKEGRLAKWAAEIRTYDISYIPRKEAEGLVMKKFFGQGEQVEGTPNANEGGTFTLSKKLQVKSTPTPRAWRLYVGKETIEEGLAACINQGMKDLHVFIDSLTLVAQEVSMGIKTRPAVEETSSSKKGKAASNAPRAEPNYNREASGRVKQKVKRGLLFIEKEGKDATIEKLSHDTLQRKHTRLRGRDEVRSHHQNSGEAGMSKDISGPELLAPS